MKRFMPFLLIGLLALGVVTLAAAPADLTKADTKLVGDPHKLDTKYEGPFNVDLIKWFETHPFEPGKSMRSEILFQTPRVTAMALKIKGPFPMHYHLQCDEIIYPIKGTAKEWVNGKWETLKPGIVHYNPRGLVHGGQFDEEFWGVVFFTPAPPPAGERVWTKDTSYKPGDVAVDWKLVDTQFMTGQMIDVEKFLAEHPIPAGQPMRADFVVGTPRSQYVIGQKPKLDPHYHGSSDEIIFVYKGTGEMYINGEWVKVTPGFIHFNARGFIHGIRPVTDDFRIFALFTPPSANGNDRIFIGK